MGSVSYSTVYEFADMTPPMADSFGRRVDRVASSVSNVIKT